MNNRIINTLKTITNRYKTSDPFVIAEKLNVDLNWVSIGKLPLGLTIYEQHRPIVLLNDSIKGSSQQYFTLAHELGHVILHGDIPGYHTGRLSKGIREREANEFATGLMGLLYVEDNGYQPDNYYELVHHYGSPVRELD